MPPALEKLALPFVTRDMLAFQEGLTLSLRITSQSDSATPVTIRGYTREGTFTFKHVPHSNFTVATDEFSIADFPVFVSVVDESGFYLQGEIYVRVSLLLNGDIVQELCTGLVSAQAGICYPATNIQQARPNGGFIQTFKGTDPAAGVEISEAVPSGVIWRVMSVNFTLVTDANVANRRVHLVIADGTSTHAHFISSVDQAAGATVNYTFTSIGGAGTYNDNNKTVVPIAQSILLTSGQVISTITTNKQATDNFSKPVILLERWYDIPY